MKAQNLVGQKFGRLTVVSRAENDKYGKTMWNCICDCGKVKEKPVIAYQLKSGKTKSCGCKKSEAMKLENQKHIKHGMKATKLYGVWHDIKTRCYNQNSDSYKYYGFRRIKMCDEWKENFSAFSKWAFENGYSEGLTIDRINNDGDYSPDNCRWVTFKIQANNKSNNTRILFNGETHTISEWADITGIDCLRISQRLRLGWSVERTLTEKPKTRKSRRINK